VCGRPPSPSSIGAGYSRVGGSGPWHPPLPKLKATAMSSEDVEGLEDPIQGIEVGIGDDLDQHEDGVRGVGGNRSQDHNRGGGPVPKLGSPPGTPRYWSGPVISGSGLAMGTVSPAISTVKPLSPSVTGLPPMRVAVRTTRRRTRPPTTDNPTIALRFTAETRVSRV
jgi:hypothetical protein